MKIWIVLFILISLEVLAKRLPDINRPIWSMGMGGVSAPFPRDIDMPTINAAYLSHVQEMGLELFTLGVGGPGITKFGEIQELPPMESFSSLNEYMGLPLWAGANGRFSVIAPYFGISGYINYGLYTYLNNPLVPELYVNFANDSGITTAFGIPVGPGSSFGIAFKRITRWGGEKVIDYSLIDEYMQTEDTSVILDELSDKGIGYGADISYLYKPQESGPVFTVIWKDVGYTTFQKTSGNSSPPGIAENLTMGLGYILDGPGIDVRAGLEYRYITTQNMQLGNKLHLGAELSLPLVDLRAGLHQGYSTFGFGMNLWILRFEVAQYTEELGEYPGQRPDPRIQVGLTLDLSVDANFSITSNNGSNAGKKRKLKQRR